MQPQIPHRRLVAWLSSALATTLVVTLLAVIIVGNTQSVQNDGDTSGIGPGGRQLLQTSSAAAKAHRNKLHHVHGWLMCLAWGALIPIAVVIATFRSVYGMGTWWFHLHRMLNILGFLVSLAGVAVGVYLDPGEGGLTWQHKIIGITVNVAALVQILAALLAKPGDTSRLRRAWNLTHWTLGRSTLTLAIANIFIGMYLSSVAYKNIIAQAVVLGGLFIIVMLKNDIEYLLVGCSPAEEQERLRAAKISGSQSDLGMTNYPAIKKDKRSKKHAGLGTTGANGHTPSSSESTQTIV